MALKHVPWETDCQAYRNAERKSERQETLGSAKPVALRDANRYSVILGVFHNAGYNKTVTLAQVFWMKNANAQPARLYAACERNLSIAADFSGFGREMAGLRKQLRGADIELFDSFPPYGAWFRRRFGIDNEQALELFHQTVSLKTEDLWICRDALRPWFATLKRDLLEKRLASLNEDLERHQTAIARLEEQRLGQQAQERELRRTIAENGGDQIESIDAAIRQKQDELARRRQKATRYEELVQALEQNPATTEEAFLLQRTETAAWSETTEEAESAAATAAAGRTHVHERYR